MSEGAIPTTRNNKAAVNSSDSNPGFLEDKIKSSDGSVSITVGSCNCELDLSVVGVGGIIESWKKYTIDFDDSELGTGTGTVTISIEPAAAAGTTIISTRKKQSTPFSGAAITDIDFEIGYNGQYDTPYRITTSAIPPRGESESPRFEAVSTGSIDVRFTINGGVDTDLTAGSLDFWVKTAIL